MAHHDYLGLEGGNKMVEFIIRMCALSDEEVTYNFKLVYKRIFKRNETVKVFLPIQYSQNSSGRVL